MAEFFNRADFSKFKTNIDSEDAWQDIAIIYLKQIRGFKVFNHSTPSIPALLLKRQIVIHVSNYIASVSERKVFIPPPLEYHYIDEEGISNKIELERMDPYQRYVYSIALVEFSFPRLKAITTTEVPYRYIKENIK
jgi:hypothetical protein